MANPYRERALKVVGIYLAFGFVWILATDYVVEQRLLESSFDLMQTTKGLLFVLLTAGLLFVVLSRVLAKVAETEERLHRAEEEHIRQLEATNRLLEQRVAERTQALQEANEKSSSFNYTAAHDLKSPLRAIHGFSNALREDYGEQLGEVGLDYIDRIESNARRLTELVERLLDLAHAERVELQRQPVDITRLVRNLAEEVQANYPDRTIHLTVAEGLRQTGDPTLIRTVFSNLLTNAAKFTVGDADIEVGEGEFRGIPCLYVRDRGIGFEPEHAEKIFEPFYRLHRREEYPGSGIGLATVKKIVERHGGWIAAEGTPGEGATMYLTFESPLKLQERREA